MTKSILYIANVRMPTEKGHAVQIMNMCSSFARLGWEVTLLVPHRKTQITKDPFEYYDIPKNFKISRIFALDIASKGWWSYWLDTVVFSVGAAIYALIRKPSVIYSRDSFPLAFISYFRKRGLVFEVHTVRRGFSMSRVFKVARIVTISRGIQKAYADRFGIATSSFVVEPTGVNMARFAAVPDKAALRREFGMAPDAKVVGFAGKLTTMGEEKGIVDLLKAFALVQKSHQDARLLIVGANDDEIPELRQNARAFGISDDALLSVGHVENALVSRYLGACDTLVMNYPDNEHYAHFMSPFKLFEYMASGVPFVTTDLPSIREVVDESMTCFARPNDHEALAKCVQSVFDDPKSAQIRADTARRAVVAYDWPKRAERIAASFAV